MYTLSCTLLIKLFWVITKKLKLSHFDKILRSDKGAMFNTVVICFKFSITVFSNKKGSFFVSGLISRSQPKNPQ